MAEFGTRPIALPEGYHGTVLIQDVMDLVLEVGPGDYAPTDLYRRYRELVKSRGRMGGNATAFGRVLSRLGHERIAVWRIKE